MRKTVCILMLLCLVCQPFAAVAAGEEYHTLTDEVYFGMPMEEFQTWAVENTTEQEEGMVTLEPDSTNITNFGVYEYLGFHLVMVNAKFDLDNELVEYSFSLSEATFADLEQYADKTREQAQEECFGAFAVFTQMLESVYGPATDTAYTVGDFLVIEEKKEAWPVTEEEFYEFIEGTQEETLWVRYGNVVCAMYKMPLTDVEAGEEPFMGWANMMYFYGPDSSEEAYAAFE